MHDSGSNAMTEVALGLSMAFFALLVLAMISMGIGSKDNQQSTISKQTAHVLLDIENNEQRESSELELLSDQTLIFYVQGNYLNQALESVNPFEFSRGSALVVAIAPSAPVAELIAMQQQLSEVNAEFTMISQEWMEHMSAHGVIK